MIRKLLAAAAITVMAGAALAQPAAPVGYLGPQKWPDAARILPPAPATGSPREALDQAAFKATRKLEGTPRWALAVNDVGSGVPAMMSDFACALDAQITPQAAPKLTLLLSKVGLDVGQQVSSVKDVFKRRRPYLIDDGPICVEKTDALAASPDYPSGHATWGWTVALVLTELAPDRATPILARGRAFGESRAVCGVHSLAAVEAGRTNGGAVFATLNGDPAFRADLEAARAELDALRRSAPKPARDCAAEAALIAAPIG